METVSFVSLRPFGDPPQDPWNIEGGGETKFTVSHGTSHQVFQLYLPTQK